MLDSLPDFAQRYGPTALITGASEGTGAAFARHIAAQGIDLVLLARRPDPLRTLAKEIESTSAVQVRTVAADLTSPTLLDDIADATDGLDIGLLIHNAGASVGNGLFADRPPSDALHLLDLNCRSTVTLAHRYGRLMIDRRRGGIVLMTSLSSVAGNGYNAAYSASKAFERVLAEALWMEYGQAGVDVLGVVAGLTDTPAARREGLVKPDGTALGGFTPMPSDDVVREALAALGNGSPLHTPGKANRAAAQAMWPVPRRDLVMTMTDSNADLYGLDRLTAPQPR
ncbi:SDR family NAD(P)-dependent oxidoreductase [Streptomyces sp. NBC_00466]|uniref:SDR family NAD(P)-dependent oxidoreductase n=1 Tax=Streptomyces sp. NBC_00466 TaxID=2903655 RepID=UPI0030DFD3FD